MGEVTEDKQPDKIDDKGITIFINGGFECKSERL